MPKRIGVPMCRRPAFVVLACLSTMLVVAAASAVAEPSASSDVLAEFTGSAHAVSQEEVLGRILTRTEADEQLNPEAVTWYEAYFHVTTEVARERLATQLLGSNLPALLKKRLDARFAFVWFDNASGHWVVGLDGEEGNAALQELLAERHLIGYETTQTVSFDRNELERGKEYAQTVLEPLISSGEATVGYGDGAIDLSVYTNPNVQTAQANAQRVAQLKSDLAAAPDHPPIEVTYVSAHPVASPGYTLRCENRVARLCNSIVGGDTFEDAKGRCTTGYWVEIKGREPWVPTVLTASHCISGLPQASHARTCYPGGSPCTEELLTLTYYLGYGRSDAGLIDSYAPATTFPLYAGYWNWSIGTGSQLESYETQPASPGLTVCHQGSTSGSSCGQLLRNGVTLPVTEEDGSRYTDSNMLEFSMHGCKGDSGGP